MEESWSAMMTMDKEAQNQKQEKELENFQESMLQEKALLADYPFVMVDAVEAKRRLDNDKTIVLLDVREAEEYDQSHIPDSVSLPLSRLEYGAISLPWSKNQTLMVYCRSGKRSKIAANILYNLGFDNIIEMGGILDWPFSIENRE